MHAAIQQLHSDSIAYVLRGLFALVDTGSLSNPAGAPLQATPLARPLHACRGRGCQPPRRTPPDKSRKYTHASPLECIISYLSYGCPGQAGPSRCQLWCSSGALMPLQLVATPASPPSVTGNLLATSSSQLGHLRFPSRSARGNLRTL